MAIELDNSFTVPVPPEQAWDILLDVERIAPCMPGASVTSVQVNEIEGQIKVKLGPLSLTYRGTALFTRQDRAGLTFEIEASGTETRGAGTASASLTANLKPGDTAAETVVSIHTTLNVTGRPAQFGRSLLPEVSGKLVTQFAANLEAMITAEEAAATEAAWQAELVRLAEQAVPDPARESERARGIRRWLLPRKSDDLDLWQEARPSTGEPASDPAVVAPASAVAMREPAPAPDQEPAPVDPGGHLVYPADERQVPEPAAPAQVPLRLKRGDAASESAVPAYPEPLVIGSTPALRSDLRGLPGDRHKVPDSVLDGADLGGLAIRAASLRGDAHRYQAVTRQDAMDLCSLHDGETDVILGCVADGVAVEPLSQLGAAQACRLARDETRQRLSALLSAQSTPDLLAVCQDLADSVAARLARQAGFLKTDPKSLSTTLTAVLVEAPAGPSGRRFVGFAVGDGAAFTLRDGAFHECVGYKGEAASPETVATLPTQVGRVSIFQGRILPGTTLLICTDGLSNPMRNSDVRERLAAWWGEGRVPSPLEFGWQLSFRVKSYDDDRTAICFWESQPP
jgi:carbon monoxide dehydrogenase subunit G/serine/threonine protein phosphatase PrpC